MYKPFRKFRTQRGQGLVELALTMPVLVLVFAGLVHFGLTMHAQQVITNASRVGARRATQLQGNVGKIRQAVEDYIKDAGLDKNNAQIQIDLSPTNARAGVVVSYQFSSPVMSILVGFVESLTGQSLGAIDQLEASTVMRL